MVENSERAVSGELVSEPPYLLYALPAVPLALMAMTYYVYLPKYLVDQKGFSVFALSIVILISRLWDAVLDPMIGRLSDRSGTNGPRRKVWILVASIPLAVAFAAMFFWPGNSSMMAFFVCSALFFLFFSCVLIPFEAWGITLVSNYDQRNTIMSWREGLVIVGTLLSGAIPFAVDSFGFESESSFGLISVSYSVLFLGIISLTLSKVPESGLSRVPQLDRHSFYQTLQHAWSNDHFRILVLAYVLSAIGAVIPATLILFYVEHVLESSRANLFLTLYFLAGILALPFWLKLSRRHEKKSLWLIALTVNTASFALVYLLGPGQEVQYAALVSLSGIGFGATMAIPPSMQADVIDYDEYLYSTRREGLFVGFWAIARKASAAIAASLALLGLGIAGYGAGEQPDQAAISAIRFWYTLVPCLFNFGAILVALKYSLNRKKANEIQLELAKR